MKIKDSCQNIIEKKHMFGYIPKDRGGLNDMSSEEQTRGNRVSPSSVEKCCCFRFLQ